LPFLPPSRRSSMPRWLWRAPGVPAPGSRSNCRRPEPRSGRRRER